MRRFLAIVLVVIITTCSCLGDDYVWRNATSSETVVLRPIPDGMEWAGQQKVNLWLCRIYGDTGRWIPGKLYLHDDQSRCIVGCYKETLWSTNFQTLVSAPGSTSWVPTPVGVIPANAIKAGLHRDGKKWYYVCRAAWEGSVLIGGMFEGEDKCWMPYHGKEVHVKTGIEVLVVNVYGVKT